MIQVVRPGFVEDTDIYELKENMHRKLELVLRDSVPSLAPQDLREHLNSSHVVLVDQSHPFVINTLKEQGFMVIAGRM